MNRPLAALALTAGVIAVPFAQERPTRRITIPALITAVAFAPDGKSIVAWDPGGWSTWDAESGRQTGREPVFGKACGRMPALPRSEDGRTIGVSCGGRLVVFEMASKTALGEWKFGEKETPTLFTVASGGSLAAAVLAGATGTVQVADRSGAKPIAILRTSEEIEQLSFAPGTQLIGTGTIAGVTLWSLPDGRATARIEGGSTHTFSSDGRRVAVSRSRGAVVADTSAGAVIRELQGPSTQLRFSADGNRIAGLNNQQVVVWDTATGAQRLALKSDEFTSLALSSDGLRLVTVSREMRGEATGSTLAIWRVPPPE
jgi:WD40 repeat protein